MSDKQAILFGYYGARNVGDELMLLCLNQWLKRQNIRTTVGAISASEVERLHGLPAFQDLPLLFQYAWVDVWLRGKGFGLLQRMRSADMILAGGRRFHPRRPRLEAFQLFNREIDDGISDGQSRSGW